MSFLTCRDSFLSGPCRALAILCLLSWVAGCSAVGRDLPTLSNDAEQSMAAARGAPIVPRCQSGCVDVDPSPSASGFFAGNEINGVSCFDGEHNDLDGDDLSDYCEKVLAAGFAPIMKYDVADDVRRQSYWAARPLGSGQVRIVYAIGYYYDLGVASEAYYECITSTIANLLSSCDGHNGDSEWVALDVTYNASTQHWNVTHASLSKHETVIGTWGSPYASGLEYPYHPGAAPRIWVALKKHANYTSRSTCNAGSGVPDPFSFLFPFDTCQGNGSEFVVDALGSRNLGSDSIRLLDCVQSNDPFHQGNPPPTTECFWSGANFLGWNSVIQGSATKDYGSILRNLGF